MATRGQQDFFLGHDGGWIIPRQSNVGYYLRRHLRDLIEWYGEERGQTIKVAESFQICEYGRQPSKTDLKKLFPFFD